MKKSICFTGHREIKSEEEIKKRLYSIIEEYILDGYEIFYAGGARGFDTLASEVVADLRKNTHRYVLLLFCHLKVNTGTKTTGTVTR